MQGPGDGYTVALGNNHAPQFYHIADYTTLSKDALQFVRRLYVNCDLTTFNPWFGNIILHMTGLEDIVFNLGFHPGPREVAHVFQSILKHKNRPRVHVHFELEIEDTSLSSIFDWLKKEWSDFGKLNVESLTIKYPHKDLRFPKFFFETVRGFTSLKNLKLICGHGSVELSEVNTALNGKFGMHHIATFLKDMPNLECLHLDIPPTDFEWPELPHLRQLVAPLSSFDMSCTFEMFDNVTQLQLTDGKSPKARNKSILPSFRNLKSLGLCGEHPNLPALMDHFLKHNSRLVNVSLEEGNLNLSPDTLATLLSRVERLDIPAEWPLPLAMTLYTSKKLQHILYTGLIDGEDDEYVSLGLLVQATLDNEVSPDLKTIQVDLLCLGPCKDENADVVTLEELQSFFEEELPSEVVKAMILPVCPINGRVSHTAVIDLDAIRELRAKGKFHAVKMF